MKKSISYRTSTTIRSIIAAVLAVSILAVAGATSLSPLLSLKQHVYAAAQAKQEQSIIQSTPAVTLTPPTPQTGTLLVTNDITCPQGFTCPQPSDFTMHVTGNNPDPSSFSGSSSGTTVTLNPGNYNVAEDVPATPIQLN